MIIGSKDNRRELSFKRVSARNFHSIEGNVDCTGMVLRSMKAPILAPKQRQKSDPSFMMRSYP